jgi:hypothetical protein
MILLSLNTARKARNLFLYKELYFPKVNIEATVYVKVDGNP